MAAQLVKWGTRAVDEPSVNRADAARTAENCADCGLPAAGAYRCPACTRSRARSRVVADGLAAPPEPPEPPNPLARLIWYGYGSRSWRGYLRVQAAGAGVVVALVAAALVYVSVFGAGTVGQPPPAQQVAGRVATALANGDVAHARRALCADAQNLDVSSLAAGRWTYIGASPAADSSRQQLVFGQPNGERVTITVSSMPSGVCVDGIRPGEGGP